jgi:hypothetical protein
MKSAAFPGSPEFKAVKRPEAFSVEGHPCVLEAGLPCRVFLHFGIMGRGEEVAALCAKFFQYCDGKTHPLRGIGAGAELVEQDERFLRRSA